MLTVPALVGLLAATTSPTPAVHAPGPDADACREAGSTIRIQASSKVVARDVVAITYRITNRGAVPLTWVRLGGRFPHQGHEVRLAGPVRAGPFSAGATSTCWWGRTRSSWELSERDPVVAKLNGAAVRPFRHDGAWHLLVDVPMREGTMRLSRRPIIPKLFSSAAVSWGVVSGFSVDTSIGIGLNWTPSEYVSATVQRRFGTFFFTNRTHLRSASLDINLPFPRPPLSQVKHYDTKYLAVGVEYFQRDVVGSVLSLVEK